MRKSTFVIVGSIVISFIGYQMVQAGGSGAGEFLMVVPPLIGIPWGVKMSKKEARKAYDALSDEERAKVDAERERKAAAAQERLEQLKADTTIVSTAIVNSTTVGKQKSSVGSSFVRGAVGGAVFGPVGMIAGAVTPKKKLTTKTKDVTFSVRYASGRCEVEKVKFGSSRYNELAKYIA